MQPFLAESAPRRGRAMALAIALTFVAGLAVLAATPHRARAPGHHHHQRTGRCPYSGQVYLVR